jgi:glycerol-3-phosphate cytidylyltransferase
MNSLVYVIGVFDLCHVGHFNLLLNCHAMGGRLVVGITSDALVFSTKKRPTIQSASKRKDALMSIPFVSDVVEYDHIDQTPNLQTLKPTVLVVPPDYGYLPDHHNTIHTAENMGIEVKSFPRTQNVSTTELRPFVDTCAIGIDFHDTFTYNVPFFKWLLRNWTLGKRYIVTGDNDAQSIRDLLLQKFDMLESDFDEVLGCGNGTYALDQDHYDRVANAKVESIKSHNIKIYYDDNPIYAERTRNHACVFHTFLSDAYIEAFNKMQKHENINFQLHVHSYIRNDAVNWVSKSNLWKSSKTYPPFPHIKARRKHELNYLTSKLAGQDTSYVLDIGCGDGATLMCLEHLIDADVLHGCDIALQMMEAIPSRPPFKKQFYDINSRKELPTSEATVILMLGVVNYIFDNDIALALFRRFTKTKNVFLRCICTLRDADETINTYSEALQSQYIAMYRTLDSTCDLIRAAGLNIVSAERIYPDDIESKFDTKQYMIHCSPVK